VSFISSYCLSPLTYQKSNVAVSRSNLHYPGIESPKSPLVVQRELISRTYPSYGPRLQWQAHIPRTESCSRILVTAMTGPFVAPRGMGWETVFQCIRKNIPVLPFSAKFPWHLTSAWLEWQNWGLAILHWCSMPTATKAFSPGSREIDGGFDRFIIWRFLSKWSLNSLNVVNLRHSCLSSTSRRSSYSRQFFSFQVRTIFQISMSEGGWCFCVNQYTSRRIHIVTNFYKFRILNFDEGRKK